MECERYELKNDKLCIDVTRRYKKNAIFREFARNEKTGEKKLFINKHISSLLSNSEIKLEKVNIFGEEYFFGLRKPSKNEYYLTDLSILESFPPRRCETIRTGYIGLQVVDEKLKPTNLQKSEKKRYCEGPKYNHRVFKAK